MVLSGLKVAVDVQHVFRDGEHRNDRGTVFRLADGLKMNEADAASLYAHAIIGAIAEQGAEVLTNDPLRGVLVGSYEALPAVMDELIVKALAEQGKR